MTKQQFMKHLESISNHKFKFRILGGVIRTKYEDCKYDFCPLTAVCKSLTGDEYALSHYVEAARIIGISHECAREIVCAADGCYGKTRNQLLKALKLEEPNG